MAADHLHGAVAKRARYKLATSMLTTYGYAIMGAAAIQPFLIAGARPSFAQVIAIALGEAGHLLALYICPRGEKP